MGGCTGRKVACGPLGGEEASAVWAFQVEDDPLEIGFIEDLFPFGCAEQQSTATEIVDAAGHALGVIVDAADEAVAEEGTLEARYP